MILQVEWFSLNCVYKFYENNIDCSSLSFPQTNSKALVLTQVPFTGQLATSPSPHPRSPLTCIILQTSICPHYFHILNKQIKLSYNMLPFKECGIPSLSWQSLLCHLHFSSGKCHSFFPTTTKHSESQHSVASFLQQADLCGI